MTRCIEYHMQSFDLSLLTISHFPPSNARKAPARYLTNSAIKTRQSSRPVRLYALPPTDSGTLSASYPYFSFMLSTNCTYFSFASSEVIPSSTTFCHARFFALPYFASIINPNSQSVPSFHEAQKASWMDELL
jgi:hypothetical protein